MDWREEAQNTLLSGAWNEYTAALNEGKSLELEANYKTWVAQALNEAIAIPAPQHELD